MNKVVLIGIVCTDPELRYTRADAPVLNFRLVTREQWRTADGTKDGREDFHGVSYFGSSAESLSKILSKRCIVAIDGRLQYDKVEKDGLTSIKAAIIASRVDIIKFAGDREDFDFNSAEPAFGNR